MPFHHHFWEIPLAYISTHVSICDHKHQQSDRNACHRTRIRNFPLENRSQIGKHKTEEWCELVLCIASKTESSFYLFDLLQQRHIGCHQNVVSYQRSSWRSCAPGRSRCLLAKPWPRQRGVKTRNQRNTLILWKRRDLDMEKRTKETSQGLHVTNSRCFNCYNCLQRTNVREVATGGPDTKRTEDIYSPAHEGGERRRSVTDWPTLKSIQTNRVTRRHRTTHCCRVRR